MHDDSNPPLPSGLDAPILVIVDASDGSMPEAFARVRRIQANYPGLATLVVSRPHPPEGLVPESPVCIVQPVSVEELCDLVDKVVCINLERKDGQDWAAHGGG